MNKLTYSRLLLLGLTVLDLSVMLGCGLAMQYPLFLVKAMAVLALFLAALGIILLSREWVNPSHIFRQGEQVAVHWNNWEIRGSLLEAGLSENRPRRLELTLKEPDVLLYPVGPMFILAGLVFRPWLSWFPALLRGHYYYRKDRLLADAHFVEDRLTIQIPLIFIGKRKARKWLG